MHAKRLTTAVLVLLGSALVAHAGEKSLRQAIDAEVKSAWAKEQVKPAPRSSDSTFLRRVFLDLVGTIPSYDEAKAFLDDADPAKRDKLIDRLLDDPRFATQQAHVWDLVLFGRRPGNLDATRKRDGFQRWLADQFAKNVPYDQWVRNLLLAEQDESGLFYVQHRNQPEEATVAVTRIFLGTQLQCARCHDHPYEAWTQRDFYGMAGFFVRLVVVEGEAVKGKRKVTIGEKSTGEVLFTGSAKEQRPGQKGEPIKPKFLGGKELAEPAVPKDFKEAVLKGSAVPPKPLFSRKQKLVDWLVSPDNPYFAKAAANRVWAQLMGRGVVHPIDDLSEKNEPSHPGLLQALTKDLLARKFDLKGFIREIVRSDAYQLGDTGEVADALPTLFERARVRPLSAEELMASLRTASGDAPNAKAPGDTSEYFLRYFGEPTDGQGTFQGGLAEHLFLNNASQFRVFAQARKGNLADGLVATKAPWEEKVDRLFLSVLSRPPRPEERKRFVAHLSSDAKMVPTLVEESIWVLMSCAEFRFNH